MSPESLMDIVVELGTEIGYTDDELTAQTITDRLKRYTMRGEQKLNKIAGSEIDYDADLVARGLLINFGLYCNSQVEEHFENNYAKELAALNADYSVKEYLSNGGGSGEES